MHRILATLDARYPERDLPLDPWAMMSAVVLRISDADDRILAIALYPHALAVVYQAGTMSLQGSEGGRAVANAFATWLAENDVDEITLGCMTTRQYEDMLQRGEYGSHLVGTCPPEELTALRGVFDPGRTGMPKVSYRWERTEDGARCTATATNPITGQPLTGGFSVDWMGVQSFADGPGQLLGLRLRNEIERALRTQLHAQVMVDRDDAERRRRS